MMRKVLLHVAPLWDETLFWPVYQVVDAGKGSITALDFFFILKAMAA